MAEPLWRYFKTERFLELLRNSSLYFSSARRFEDPFEEASNRLDDRTRILKALVLPAVLFDMLHYLYEAPECSLKVKLNVTYALIRKPLQESLFVLESIVLDEAGFAETLARNPLMLRSRTVGGVDGHACHIQKVLEITGTTNQFDAEYLA